MYKKKRKRSIDNLSKCVFYYKYQARDVNDNTDWYWSYINVFIVNGYLAIKKTYGENGREQVNDINIGGKKREKEKKINGTITLSLSLKAIICYIDDH